MSRSLFEYDIKLREYDNQWAVVGKVSAVRLGLVRRELVKAGDAIDHDKWLTLFVGKNQKECKNWVDSNWDNLLMLGIPYEVTT